jgi:hypothetical protein
MHVFVFQAVSILLIAEKTTSIYQLLVFVRGPL